MGVGLRLLTSEKSLFFRETGEVYFKNYSTNHLTWPDLGVAAADKKASGTSTWSWALVSHLDFSGRDWAVCFTHPLKSKMFHFGWIWPLPSRMRALSRPDPPPLTVCGGDPILKPICLLLCSSHFITISETMFLVSHVTFPKAPFHRPWPSLCTGSSTHRFTFQDQHTTAVP